MSSSSVTGLSTAAPGTTRLSQRSTASERTSSTASATSTAASKDPAQLAAQAAATAGVSSTATLDAFTSFLTGKTNTAAFWSVTGSNAAAGALPSPTLTGVTFDKDGIPDFSAIIAAGGKVTGALAPDGQSVFSVGCDGRLTVQYAVEIDRGDGSAPVLLKGVNVTVDGSVDRAGRADALACAAKMFAAMPNSLEEVRARCWAGRSAWTAPQRSIDMTA